MDYGDYYWGLYRGYYRDPFPHSLLSTRQKSLYYSTPYRSRVVTLIDPFKGTLF